MSSLQFTERSLLEKILGMRTGYVSDFSDRTFREFVLEKTGIDILTESYEEAGTSKANRLRTFWKKAPDEVTAVLIEALLEYSLKEKTGYDGELSVRDEYLFIEARKIVQRLTDQSNAVSRNAPPLSLVSTTQLNPSPKHEELKKSLVAFLSDPHFPQKKRKIETIKDHFPTLGEAELMQLLSQVGAIRYRGNDSELWGIPSSPGYIKSVHIAGDYVAGDKVGRDKNTTKTRGEKDRIPPWLQYAVAIATVLAFLWGVYIYFNPSSIMGDSQQSISASTSTDLRNILVGSIFNLVQDVRGIDKELLKDDFFQNNKGRIFEAEGTISQIGKFESGEVWVTLLGTTTDGNTESIECHFDNSWEKTLRNFLITNKQEIKFSGEVGYYVKGVIVAINCKVLEVKN